MFQEMRIIARLKGEGLTDQRVIDRAVADNLFQYPTESPTNKSQGFRERFSK